MNKLFRITATYKDGRVVTDEFVSFNIMDATEEWNVNHEQDCEEIIDISCKYLGVKFNHEHS